MTGVALHDRALRWTGVSLLVAASVGAAALAIPLVLYGVLSGHWLVAGLGALLGATGVGSLLLAERLLYGRPGISQPLYPDTVDEARMGGVVGGLCLYGFLSVISLILLFAAGLTGRGGDGVPVAAILLPAPGLLLAAVSYLAGKR
jgi:hypothetical protein